MDLIKPFTLAILLAASEFSALAQNAPSGLSGEQVVERVSPSAVLILVGKGDGQVAALGSGLIVRPDGVILTAYHLVKGMREVQVRLRNGEVYDQVELLAADERRDAATLRIAATGLAVLPVASPSVVASGAQVFLISSGAGLPWSASSGILSAMRMADDVPGAGSGYRLLQFTAAVAPGSSGGVLVDTQGRALGMVVGSVSAGQNLNFAVPLESVAGLASASGGTPFSSGAKLQMPTAFATESPTPARSPAVPSPPTGLSLPRPDQLGESLDTHHSMPCDICFRSKVVGEGIGD
jgi:S1-C subfamily serine protease